MGEGLDAGHERRDGGLRPRRATLGALEPDARLREPVEVRGHVGHEAPADAEVVRAQGVDQDHEHVGRLVLRARDEGRRAEEPRSRSLDAKAQPHALARPAGERSAVRGPGRVARPGGSEVREGVRPVAVDDLEDAIAAASGRRIGPAQLGVAGRQVDRDLDRGAGRDRPGRPQRSADVRRDARGRAARGKRPPRLDADPQQGRALGVGAFEQDLEPRESPRPSGVAEAAVERLVEIDREREGRVRIQAGLEGDLEPSQRAMLADELIAHRMGNDGDPGGTAGSQGQPQDARARQPVARQDRARVAQGPGRRGDGPLLECAVAQVQQRSRRRGTVARRDDRRLAPEEADGLR